MLNSSISYQVLLVSDPTTDMSAAALDVHIGYMVDDQDLPGLAHFCEHMRKLVFRSSLIHPGSNLMHN